VTNIVSVRETLHRKPSFLFMSHVLKVGVMSTLHKSANDHYRLTTGSCRDMARNQVSTRWPKL